MGNRGTWNPIDVVAGGLSSAKDQSLSFLQDPIETIKEKGRDINQTAVSVGDTVQKTGQDIGNTVEKTGQDIGTSVEKANQDTQTAVQKALIQIGDIFDPSKWSNSKGKSDTSNSNGTTNNGDTSLPSLGTTDSYSLSTEAAKRRKQLLLQQKGFISTIKSTNKSANTNTNLLTPNITGKTKLGQ
jgi:hypothetical protein